MEVGLVGKPNVGKSTMFSAITLVDAQIASYPFTTIEANRGMGYVRQPCPHMELEVRCNPNNSRCEDGTRFIPVELIDVAGLVPEAHQGKGLGNKFLDDLRQASALIHVIDASGETDAEGNIVKRGEHDPGKDVEFLGDEIAFWIKKILSKGWQKIAKTVEMMGDRTDRALLRQLTGLAVTETQIQAALRKAELDVTHPSRWSDEELLSLCRHLQMISKPIIVAANKADKADEETLARLTSMEREGLLVIPTSAEYELALRRAARAGLVDYEIGSGDFTVKEPGKLSEAQQNALEKIREFLDRFGSTGVQRCLEEAIFTLLDRIVVYPVEDETHYTNKDGDILPDCFLVKKGITAKEFAYYVHTEIGDSFIRAIDARTRRVVGADHELANNDVIKIVSHK